MNASSRILIAALSLFGLIGSAAHAREPGKVEPSTKHFAVKVYHDFTYYDIRRDPDRQRHQLDIYRPKGQTKCPVLFFVHGGAWTIASKDEVFGIYGYGMIGRCLAERGLVVVMPNYRLSPGVKHPEHIKDVARAFAWTCQHVAEFGGDPDRFTSPAIRRAVISSHCWLPIPRTSKRRAAVYATFRASSASAAFTASTISTSNS